MLSKSLKVSQPWFSQANIKPNKLLNNNAQSPGEAVVLTAAKDITELSKAVVGVMKQLKHFLAPFD